MNFKNTAFAAAAVAFIGFGFSKYGWQGVAVVIGGIVFWMLLHFTRMMTVMKRAAGTPMGHVASAVMLNAKLKKGVNLLHVMALTRSIGLLQTENGVQPEVYRWQDNGLSHVTCTFTRGKLESWALYRPPADSDEPAPAPPASQ